MSTETPSAAILRFGTFEMDLRAGELRKQGLRLRLQEQPFRVLSILLEHPGQVVTREELRARLWPADTFVDFDNSLNTSINKLREALGDSAESPHFIETLPRRGYRFIAPVSGHHRSGAVAATSSQPSHRWKIAMAMTAVVVVLISGRFYWRSRQALRLTEKDTVVLADFLNTTGDTVFDDALKQGLRVQLEQSPFLNVVSEEKIGRELRLMGHKKNERLTRDLALDLCQRLDSKAVLIGSIASLGAHYAIGLNALDCRTGDELASDQVEVDSRENVLRALGESATKIRKKLGESLASVQKYDAPIEQATTPSLEALRAYSSGIKTWQLKGDAAAIPLFQRAVELDPKFAMAYARLGQMYANQDRPPLARENITKAYELRDNVSERERLYIESHYYGVETGDLESVIRVTELWQRTYPRDPVPYNDLAFYYSSIGHSQQALEEAREALRLEPDNEDNYVTVFNSYVALNRFGEAEETLNLAERRKLEGNLLVAAHHQLAFLRDDEPQMEKLMAAGAGKPDLEAGLLGWTGCAVGYHGQLKRSRELLHRSVELSEHYENEPYAAACLAGLGLIEAYLGDRKHAWSDSEAAARLGPPDSTSASVLALAVAGNTAQAEKLSDLLNKHFPRNWWIQRRELPTIRAAVALERKEPLTAIRLLEPMRAYEFAGQLDPIFLRGQAFFMTDKPAAAATEFQKIIDHPGLVMCNPVGALARLGLGRAYALQGNADKARTSYQDFFSLWKDADPDIPILKQAKAEYAKLQ